MHTVLSHFSTCIRFLYMYTVHCSCTQSTADLGSLPIVKAVQCRCTQVAQANNAGLMFHGCQGLRFKGTIAQSRMVIQLYEDFDHSSSQQLWQFNQQGFSKQDEKECECSAQPLGTNLHLVTGTPAKTPPPCLDPLTQGHQSLH